MSNVKLNEITSLDGTATGDVKDIIATSKTNAKDTFFSPVGLSGIGSIDLSKYKFAIFHFHTDLGDGGHVDLYKDNASTANGSLTDSAGNKWFREEYTTVNVAQYGFKAANTAAGNKAAILAALSSNTNAYSQNVELAFPPGTYTCDGGISWGHRVKFRSGGKDMCRINFVINTGDTIQAAVRCDALNSFEGMEFALDASSTSTTAVGIQSSVPTVNNGFARSRITDFRLRGFAMCLGSTSASLSMTYWTILHDVEITEYTSRGINLLGGSNAFYMDKVWFLAGAGRDLYLNSIESVFGDNLYFQSPNSDYNIFAENCQNVSFRNINYEPLKSNILIACPNFHIESIQVNTHLTTSSGRAFTIRPDPTTANSKFVQRYSIDKIEFFNLEKDVSVVGTDAAIAAGTAYEVKVTGVANRSTTWNVTPYGNLVALRFVPDVPMLGNDADPIIECGSNANGTYFRFGSGRQVCIGIESSLAGWGTTGWKTATTWTLPKSFNGATFAPLYSMRIDASDYSKLYHVLPSFPDGTGNTAVYQFNVTATFAIAPIFRPYAIGMWR